MVTASEISTKMIHKKVVIDNYQTVLETQDSNLYYLNPKFSALPIKLVSNVNILTHLEVRKRR